MDISEIKQLRTDLRVEIEKLISEFENKTKIKVLAVNVNRYVMNYGKNNLVQVGLKIDLC